MLDFFPIALEHVVNSLDQGVIILNERKKLVGCNDAAASVLPALRGDMIGLPLDKALSAYPSISQLISQRDAGETEIEINHDREPRHFHVSYHPVTRKGKRIPGYTILLNEITQSKQKEQKLIEKGRDLEMQNITKDKFLTIIAHDLRNPFHILINLSEIMLRTVEKGDVKRVARIAGVLHDTTRSTYNLLQNLLEWALIQKSGLRLNLQLIKVKDLILDEIGDQKQVLKQKKINLQSRVSSKLTLQADEHMVKMIIRNLISNAVKYSYPESTVTIIATSGDGTITFEVKDCGTGMTEEEQQLIFHMDANFTKRGTASEPGSGLGLALCQEFVKLHGGTIWVKSLPGKGSSFYFRLPQNPV
jgi:signal transduction histidine kinase